MRHGLIRMSDVPFVRSALGGTSRSLGMKGVKGLPWLLSYIWTSWSFLKPFLLSLIWSKILSGKGSKLSFKVVSQFSW